MDWFRVHLLASESYRIDCQATVLKVKMSARRVPFPLGVSLSITIGTFKRRTPQANGTGVDAATHTSMDRSP